MSHNLISSLLINQTADSTSQILSIFTVWPNLEILDLTNNKLNDFEEVLQMASGMAMRKETIKAICVKGNQFYN